jgi:hypothetical protein
VHYTRCSRLIDDIDSTLPCFAAFGEQTAVYLRDRFQQALTHSLVEEHVNRLIDTSLGSHWTRLYDSVRCCSNKFTYDSTERIHDSINITRNQSYSFLSFIHRVTVLSTGTHCTHLSPAHTILIRSALN